MIAETEVELFMLTQVSNNPDDNRITKGPEHCAGTGNFLLLFRRRSSDTLSICRETDSGQRPSFGWTIDRKTNCLSYVGFKDACSRLKDILKVCVSRSTYFFL